MLLQDDVQWYQMLVHQTLRLRVSSALSFAGLDWRLVFATVPLSTSSTSSRVTQASRLSTTWTPRLPSESAGNLKGVLGSLAGSLRLPGSRHTGKQDFQPALPVASSPAEVAYKSCLRMVDS